MSTGKTTRIGGLYNAPKVRTPPQFREGSVTFNLQSALHGPQLKSFKTAFDNFKRRAYGSGLVLRVAEDVVTISANSTEALTRAIEFMELRFEPEPPKPKPAAKKGVAAKKLH